MVNMVHKFYWWCQIVKVLYQIVSDECYKQTGSYILPISDSNAGDLLSCYILALNVVYIIQIFITKNWLYRQMRDLCAIADLVIITSVSQAVCNAWFMWTAGHWVTGQVLSMLTAFGVLRERRRLSCTCSMVHTVYSCICCFKSSGFLRFYARQHICYSAYMLSPVRPSVRLSHGCIIEKRLKLRLWNFHHTVAPSL